MSEATSTLLPVLGQTSQSASSIALVGNPNAGKTTLFNALTGLRAKTANFPGTTVDHRQATISLDGGRHQLVDLPGAYSLEGVSPEEEVTRDALAGKLGNKAIPDVIVLVLDATQLTRNLVFASQVLELGKPTLVALNMIDEAEANGLEIDVDQLSAELGCDVVPIAARHGRNLDTLLHKLTSLVQEPQAGTCGSTAACSGCSGCQYASRFRWATDLTRRSVQGEDTRRTFRNEAIDRIVTHPWLGLAWFAVLMAVTFMLIFWLASYPMDWLDGMFGTAAEWVGGFLPAGDFSDLITEGLIGGVGGMLVFLPQIFILFFMITLLEDSGYLARAAFVMDRLMHRVGLPGKAFVPMLAAHACAIPAIMSSRVIDDRRDRLNTILVLPLMTCSARLPVFAMVVALIFPHNAVWAGLTFASAYAIAIIAALVLSFIFRRTILPGKTKPLVIELPPYRLPSLRNALTTSLDQARLFVRKAGTTILVFSLVLWVVATYPKTAPEALPPVWQEQLATAEASGDSEVYDTTLAQAQGEYSIAGRMGKFIQPVFAPLGYDWRLSVGVINSFAAREVMVSTLAVLYGSVDEESGLLDSLHTAKTAEGNLVFTTPTCLSLLIFYIFAMQCFPTLVVVKRELKGWGWPAFQLVYMTVLAYVSALITYQASSYFLAA